MSVQSVAPGVHVVSLGFPNAVVLEDDNGPVIVDTGWPKSEGKIVDALKNIGFSPNEVQKIIVTHLHPDHTGSLAELKRITGAPVVMHAIDAEEVRKGVSGRTMKLRFGMVPLILFLRILPGAILTNLPPTEIEENVNDGDTLDLAGGIDVLHTPGHSAGHIALYLPRDGGILIVGDLAINVMGFRSVPFAEDHSVVLSSLKRVAQLQFNTAIFMHGKPITGNASQQFAAMWG